MLDSLGCKIHPRSLGRLWEVYRRPRRLEKDCLHRRRRPRGVRQGGCHMIGQVGHVIINVILFDYPPENRPLERPRRRVQDNNSSEERRRDEPPRYRTQQNCDRRETQRWDTLTGTFCQCTCPTCDVGLSRLRFPEMAPSINCNECPLKFTSIQDAMNHGRRLMLAIELRSTIN